MFLKGRDYSPMVVPPPRAGRHSFFLLVKTPYAFILHMLARTRRLPLSLVLGSLSTFLIIIIICILVYFSFNFIITMVMIITYYK